MIKLEDGGPVFFSQDRAGEGGRVFRVWKFRSMIPDAERHVGAIQATEGDPRVTRIGTPDARHGDGRAPAAVEHLHR